MAGLNHVNEIVFSTARKLSCKKIHQLPEIFRFSGDEFTSRIDCFSMERLLQEIECCESVYTWIDNFKHNLSNKLLFETVKHI